jgi:coenzyme F420 hydrogenase subunit beta
VHVCQLLDEGVTFALAAKPCDITAVRALGRIDPRVEKQIPYMITIFCGGLPSRHAALKIAKKHGVAEDDISVCRYRGHGWPGLFTIGRKSDGKEFGTTYNETWSWPFNPLGPNAGISKYDIQWRCKVCPDAIGECADVSCPDGWLYNEKQGRFVSDECGDTNPGQNLVLVRTAKGEELVKGCQAAGKLELAPLKIKELEIMHADHLPRKCSWPVRLLAIWWGGGGWSFMIYNYRPWAAMWWSLLTAGLRGTWQGAFRGTLDRVRQGMNQEPAPPRPANIWFNTRFQKD